MDTSKPPVAPSFRKRKLLIVTVIIAALAVVATAAMFASSKAFRSAIPAVFPITPEQGQEFTLFLNQSAEVRGTGMIVTLTGFNRPVCDMGPNDIGIKPCENEAYYKVLADGQTLSGWGGESARGAALNSWDHPRFDVIFLDSDYLTKATFVVDSSEHRCEISGYPDDCFGSIAQRYKDPQYCERISPEGHRDSCWITVANLRKDPSLCQNVVIEAAKDKCVVDLASRSGDSTACEPLTGYDADACWSNIFRATGDEAACDRIVPGLLQDECLYKIAQAKKDSSYCGRMTTNPVMKDNCWLMFPSKADAGSNCSNISADYNREECYLRSYEQTGDIAFCEMIPPSSRWNDACWIKAWEKTGDASYCQKVVSEYRKTELCGKKR